MKHVVLDGEERLTCPYCGAHEFSNRRTRSAKLSLGLAVGVGALIAPKRLQCLACREYLKGPPVRQLPTASSSAGEDVVVTGYHGSADELEAALDGVFPPKFGQDRRGLIRSLLSGEPTLIDTLPRDNAARLSTALEQAGFLVAGEPDAAEAEVDAGHGQPGSPSSEPDVMEQLRKLGELRAGGVLTDAEFNAKKADLLSRL